MGKRNIFSVNLSRAETVSKITYTLVITGINVYCFEFLYNNRIKYTLFLVVLKDFIVSMEEK